MSLPRSSKASKGKEKQNANEATPLLDNEISTLGNLEVLPIEIQLYILSFLVPVKTNVTLTLMDLKDITRFSLVNWAANNAVKTTQIQIRSRQTINIDGQSRVEDDEIITTYPPVLSILSDKQNKEFKLETLRNNPWIKLDESKTIRGIDSYCNNISGSWPGNLTACFVLCLGGTVGGLIGSLINSNAALAGGGVGGLVCAPIGLTIYIGARCLKNFGLFKISSKKAEIADLERGLIAPLSCAVKK